MNDKDYIAVVQCHIVMEHCSGYFCEKAFHERTGGFAGYLPDKPYRVVYFTCGGCCGKALHRKLSHLVKRLSEKEGISRDKIGVQLASCITRDNHHGPPCPFLQYLKTLIAKVGLDLGEDTTVSKKAEEGRRTGRYRSKLPDAI